MSKFDRLIMGRVLNVHHLGAIEEKVLICHFDPRFVVSIQTDDGVVNLAIHSPAMTFMARDPVGKRYMFPLSERENYFLLESVEEY